MEEEDERLGVDLTRAFRRLDTTATASTHPKPMPTSASRSRPRPAPTGMDQSVPHGSSYPQQQQEEEEEEVEPCHVLQVGRLFEVALQTSKRANAFHRRVFAVLSQVLRAVAAQVVCGRLLAKASVVLCCKEYVFQLQQGGWFSAATSDFYLRAAELFFSVAEKQPQEISAVEHLLLFLARFLPAANSVGWSGVGWHGWRDMGIGAVDVPQRVSREVAQVLELSQSEMYKPKELIASSHVDSLKDADKAAEEQQGGALPAQTQPFFPWLSDAPQKEIEKEKEKEKEKEDKQLRKRREYILRTVLEGKDEALVRIAERAVVNPLAAVGRGASLLFSPFKVETQRASVWALLVCQHVMRLLHGQTAYVASVSLSMRLLQRIVELIPLACPQQSDGRLLRELMSPHEAQLLFKRAPTATAALRKQFLEMLSALSGEKSPLTVCGLAAVFSSVEVAELSLHLPEKAPLPAPQLFHEMLLQAFLDAETASSALPLADACCKRILQYFRTATAHMASVVVDASTLVQLGNSSHEQRNDLLLNLLQLNPALEADILSFIVNGGRNGHALELDFGEVNLAYRIFELRKDAARVLKRGTRHDPCASQLFKRTVEFIQTCQEIDSPDLLYKSHMALLAYTCTLIPPGEYDTLMQRLVEALCELDISILSCRCVMLVEAMVRLKTGEEEFPDSLLACLEAPYYNEGNMLAEAIDVDDESSVFDLMNDSVSQTLRLKATQETEELYRPLYAYLYRAVSECFSGTKVGMNLRGYMLHVSLRVLALLPLQSEEMEGKEAELFCSLHHWSRNIGSITGTSDADAAGTLLATLKYAFSQQDLSFGSLMLHTSGALLMNLIISVEARLGQDFNFVSLLHKSIPTLAQGLKEWTDKYVELVAEEAGLSATAVQVMLAGLPRDVGTHEFAAVAAITGMREEEFEWLLSMLRTLQSDFIFYYKNLIKFTALWKDNEAEDDRPVQEEASLLHVVFLEQAMSESVLVKGKPASVRFKRLHLGLRVLVELLGKIVSTRTPESLTMNTALLQSLPTMRGGKFCEFLRGPTVTHLVEDLGLVSMYEKNHLLEERQLEAIMQCWRQREVLGVKNSCLVLECLMDNFTKRVEVKNTIPLGILLQMLQHPDIASFIVLRSLSHTLLHSNTFSEQDIATLRAARAQLVELLFQDLHSGGSQCIKLFEVAVKKEAVLRADFLEALLRQPASMYAGIRAPESLERVLSLFLYSADLDKTIVVVCGALEVVLQTAPALDKAEVSALLKVWMRFVSQVLQSFADECVQVSPLSNLIKDHQEGGNGGAGSVKDTPAVLDVVEKVACPSTGDSYTRPQILACDLSDDEEGGAGVEEPKQTQEDAQEQVVEEQEKEASQKRRQRFPGGPARASRTSSMSSENSENSQFDEETAGMEDVADKGEDQAVVPKCDSLFSTALSQDQDDQDGDQDQEPTQSQSQSQSQSQTRGSSTDNENTVAEGVSKGVGTVSALDKQLCTYTVTGTSFREQHWYHCVTCNLMKEKGCCSVCVRVCHDGHVVTYARRSRFFCDCGADELNRCHAKVARVFPEILNRSTNPVAFPSGVAFESKPRLATSTHPPVQVSTNLGSLLLNKAVLEAISSSTLLGLLERSLEWLHMAAKEEAAGKEEVAMEVDVGGEDGEKGVAEKEEREQVLLELNRATARGCAGGFMDYDHAERMGSLMATDSRGHVVVVEGRELKVLELGALVCDSAVSPGGTAYNAGVNRVPGVAVTCLSKKTMGFVPQEVLFNPANDFFLAACGKMEVCLLTLDENGSISASTRVQICHEKSAFVKHAFWLPSSQTTMAFVAHEWIKVYDFSVDVISPVQYIPTAVGSSIRAATAFHSTLIVAMSNNTIAYRSFKSIDQSSADTSLKTMEFPSGAGAPSRVTALHAIEETNQLVVILEGGKAMVFSLSFNESDTVVAVGNPDVVEVGEVGHMAQWVDLAGGVTVCIPASRTSVLAMKGATLQRLDASDEKLPVTRENHTATELTSKYIERSPCVVVGAAMWPPSSALRKPGYTSRGGMMWLEPCLLVLCNNGTVYRYMLRSVHKEMLAFRESLLNYVDKKEGEKSKAGLSFENPFPMTCNTVPPPLIFEKLVLVEDDNACNCGCSFSGDILDYCNAQRAQELLKGSSAKLVKGLRKYRSGFWLSVQCARPNLAITAVRLKIGKSTSSLSTANVILVGPFRRRVLLGTVTERWHDLPLTPREALYAASEGGLNVYLTSDDDHFVIPEIELVQIFVLPVQSRNWARYISSWEGLPAGKQSDEEIQRAEEQVAVFNECSMDIVDLVLNVCRGLEASGKPMPVGKLVDVAQLFEAQAGATALHRRWQWLLRVLLGEEAYERHCTWARLRRIIQLSSSSKLNAEGVCELSRLGKEVVEKLEAKEWEGSALLHTCITQIKQQEGLLRGEVRGVVKQAVRNTVDWALRAASAMHALPDKAKGRWKAPLHDLLDLLDGSSLAVANVAVDALVECVLEAEREKASRGSGIMEKKDLVRGSGTAVEGKEPKGKKEKTIAYRCDGCRRYPLKLERYHCTVCEDFDLCSACFADANPALHSPSHLMERIEISKDSKVASQEEAEGGTPSGLRAFCLEAVGVLAEKVERTEFTSAVYLASVLKVFSRLACSTSMSNTAKASVCAKFLPCLYRMLVRSMGEAARPGFEEAKKSTSFTSKDLYPAALHEQCLLVLLKTVRQVVTCVGKRGAEELLLDGHVERIVPPLFELIRACVEIPREYYDSHIILKPRESSKSLAKTLPTDAASQGQSASQPVGQQHAQTSSQGQSESQPQQRDAHVEAVAADGSALLEPLVVGCVEDVVEEVEEMWKGLFKQEQVEAVRGRAAVLFCQGRMPVLLLHSAVLLCTQLSAVFGDWFKKNLRESPFKKLLLQMIDLSHLRFLRSKAKAILLNLSASFDEYKFARNASVLSAEISKIERLVQSKCDKYQMRAKLLCSLDKVVKIARLFPIKVNGKSVGHLVFEDILQLPPVAAESRVVVKALQLYLLNLSKNKVKTKMTAEAPWLERSLTLCTHREEEVRTAAAAIVQQHWMLLKEEKARVRLFTEVAKHLGQFNQEMLLLLIGFLSNWHFKSKGVPKMLQGYMGVLIETLEKLVHAENNHEYVLVSRQLAALSHLQIQQEEAGGGTEVLLPPGSSLQDGSICPTCVAPVMVSKTLLLERVKAEARWTGNTMMVQLDSSYTFEALHIEMTPLVSVNGKDMLSVKEVVVYCNNEPTSELSSLKGNWRSWDKIASVKLVPRRTKMLYRLSLPVTACNLLFEYVSAQDLNSSTAAERLICPRCESIVSDRHGVCHNCGEVAFQCRLCRTINYENLNALLCVECGYCRFARFVYGIQGYPSRSWPPIRDEQGYNLAIARLKSVSAKATSLNLLLTSTRLSGKTSALKLWADFTSATSLPVDYSQKKAPSDTPKYAPTVKLVEADASGNSTSSSTSSSAGNGGGGEKKVPSAASQSSPSLSSMARSAIVTNASASVRVLNLRRLQEYTSAVQQGLSRKRSHQSSSSRSASTGMLSSSNSVGASTTSPAVAAATAKKQGLVAQLRKANRMRELKRLERSSFYRKDVTKLTDYDRYVGGSRSGGGLGELGRRSRRNRAKMRAQEQGKSSSRSKRSLVRVERTGTLSVIRKELKALEKVHKGSRAHTYDQLRLVVEEMASIRTALKVYEAQTSRVLQKEKEKAGEGEEISSVHLIPQQDFEQTCLHCGEACSLLYHELIRLLAKSHGTVCESLVKHDIVRVLWARGLTAHCSQLDSAGEALIAVISRNNVALGSFCELLLEAVSVAADAPSTLYRANWLAGPMNVFSRVSDSTNPSVLSAAAETAIAILSKVLPNEALNRRPEVIHAMIIPCTAVLIRAFLSNKKLAMAGKVTLEKYLESRLLRSWRDMSSEHTVAKWRTRAEAQAGKTLAAHFNAWRAAARGRPNRSKKTQEAERPGKPVDWFTLGLIHPTSSEVREAFEELLPGALQDGAGKSKGKGKATRAKARQDMDLLDGLAKVYLHVVSGETSKAESNDFVVFHIHKILSSAFSRHGSYLLYYLTQRGFLDALCQTLLQQAQRLCEFERLSVRHPAVVSPRLESITSLGQTLQAFLKVHNLAVVLAKWQQGTLLKAYSLLKSITLFQNPRLETAVKLVHEVCKQARLTVTRKDKEKDKDKEKEKSKEKLKKGCNDEFLGAACELLEEIVGVVEEQEEEVGLQTGLRRAAVVLDEMCAGLSQESKRSPIRVFLQRAPTQEDYFRGNIPKNPLSTDEIPVQDVDGTAGAEPTMGDLRAKIGADLDLENATDVMELLVAGKIISTSLPIRLVYDKLWKTNCNMGMGDNGSVSQDSQSDICMEEEEEMAQGASSPKKSSRMEEEDKRGIGMYDSDDAENDQDDDAAGGAAVYGEMDDEVYSDEQASMGGGNPMVVTYRLCGLDGEATEDYVEQLEDNKNVNKEDEERRLGRQSEELRKTGFECLLRLVKFITRNCDVRSKDVRTLLCSLFGLLNISCAIKSNRLCLLSLGYVPVLLDSLVTAMKHADASSQAERLLGIFELLLNQANDTEHTDSKLSAETGMSDAQVAAQLEFFIQQLDNHEEIALLRSNPAMFNSLAKLLPFLTYGKPSSVAALAEYCHKQVGTEVLKAYDAEQLEKNTKQQEVSKKLQCVLCAFEGIGRDVSSMKIRSEMLKHGLAQELVTYMEDGIEESGQDWRLLAARPSTRIVLRVLTGLVRGHAETQALVLESRLLRAAFEMEKMPSSDIKEVGDLADRFLAAAEDGNAEIQAEMKKMKEENRKRKLKEAMAKRQKLMRKMGLSGGKKRKRKKQGGGKAKKQKQSDKLSGFDWKEEMKSLKEEDGIVCTVCQEGYTYKPTEPIGVYIYSKLLGVREKASALNVPLATTPKSLNIELKKSAKKEDVEAINRIINSAEGRGRPRRDRLLVGPPGQVMACSSVTCFNCVHFSCHHVAVRADANQKNPKEEWDGALLRNGQTKCNNLIPLRGPATISEDMYKAVADGFLQAQLVDFSSSAVYKRSRDLFLLTLHDVKFLLLRLAYQEPLSEDTNGGGRMSNFKLLVPLLALALHLRKRDIAEAKQRPKSFSLTMKELIGQVVELYAQGKSPSPDIDQAFPLYAVVSLFVLSPEEWQAAKKSLFYAALSYACNISSKVALHGDAVAYGSGALSAKRSSTQASPSGGAAPAAAASSPASSGGVAAATGEAGKEKEYLLIKYKPACLLYGIVNELHKVIGACKGGKMDKLGAWLSNENEALGTCEALAMTFQEDLAVVTDVTEFLRLLDIPELTADVFV